MRRTSSGEGLVISAVGGEDDPASPRGSPSIPLLLNQKDPLKPRRKPPDCIGMDATLFNQERAEQGLSRLR